MNTIFWAALAFLGSPFFVFRARLRPARTSKKILIIQWAKLGDLVCTTPMFRAIKEAHPDWQVHVLCRERCGAAVAHSPFIDTLFAHGGSRGELIGMLRRERYDAVINCMPDAFSSLLGMLCMAPVRINTYSTHRGFLVRWSTLLNTVNLAYKIRTRTFDHYMRLLQPLGIPPIPYRLDFFFSSDDERTADAWMSQHGLTSKSFICLNITAGNAVKEWPAERFAALADSAVEHHGLSVVLSTLDRARITQVRSLMRHPDKVVDASSLSLGQCGALYRHAAAFVAVDTGPMFIAYAVGAPLVVIIGGSHPGEQIPPENERVIHVRPPAGCEPWMFVSLSPRIATEKQRICITGTTVEMVTHALDRLLQAASR